MPATPLHVREPVLAPPRRAAEAHTPRRDSSAEFTLKRWAFGGRADKGQRTVLNMGQNDPLSLIKTMHFVHEQDRALTLPFMHLRLATAWRISFTPASTAEINPVTIRTLREQAR